MYECSGACCPNEKGLICCYSCDKKHECNEVCLMANGDCKERIQTKEENEI